MKQLKEETLDRDGVVFTTTQLPAMRAYKLMTKLMKHLGPALSMLSGIDPNMDVKQLGPMLAAMLANLSENDAERLLLDVLQGTTATISGATGMMITDLNTAVKIDTVFSGRLPVMFEVAVHAIKVNYEDFAEGSDPAAPQSEAVKK